MKIWKIVLLEFVYQNVKPYQWPQDSNGVFHWNDGSAMDWSIPWTEGEPDEADSVGGVLDYIPATKTFNEE